MRRRSYQIPRLYRNAANPRISIRNFYAYLWHATFLALAQNFMDVNTIMPVMMIDADGSSLQIGNLTAIMGGWMAQRIGYAVFFGVCILVILLAADLIRLLNCQE